MWYPRSSGESGDGQDLGTLKRQAAEKAPDRDVEIRERRGVAVSAVPEVDRANALDAVVVFGDGEVALDDSQLGLQVIEAVGAVLSRAGGGA